MIWIMLSIGLVAVLLLFALLGIAKREDRAARRLEKASNPFSDVHITETGPDES